MSDKAGIGGGIVGLIFLALGVVKLAQGESWAVWIILGVLFGGLAALGKLLGGRSKA